MTSSVPPTVYADESNNSGENLTDLDQPVFAAAAVLMDSAAAASLVASVRAHMPANFGEAKYSALVKSGAGRQALLEAFAQLPDGSVRTYLAHKRFMIVAKMVDYLAVELAYDDGYDMYADGSALGLANLLFHVGPVAGDAAAFDQMLQTFVDALRPSKPTTVDDLFAAIAAYRGTAVEELRGQLGILQAARVQADEVFELIAEAKITDVLDPAIPCLVELCYDVGERVGPFRLVHDQSNTIARHALTLLSIEALPAVTPVLKLPPLPATEITFADSASTPQLQVADWVAGGSRHVADARATGKTNPFVDEVAPVAAGWVSGGVWPDADTIRTPRPPRRR
ncbi:DUF3800 domain-containing protein [Couchioplanes caeruleus]|uniref:DUF3800 domain-containing protein n=1 Tax=Couchioplanes caeruleus TaxID=56438 RepID=UPI0020BEBD0B|nr:DUF3800 domain-containing protein [Couchioplanes caeruleus]UQU66839.1 DUF3800 domain-containing protein [Couchioplanes caeruleus]